MWNSGPVISLVDSRRVLSPRLGGPGFFASPTHAPAPTVPYTVWRLLAGSATAVAVAVELAEVVPLFGPGLALAFPEGGAKEQLGRGAHALVR